MEGEALREGEVKEVRRGKEWVRRLEGTLCFTLSKGRRAVQ